MDRISYDLEYGTAEQEIQVDPFRSGRIKKVLVVDDLLATGGTMKAAVDLVERAGQGVAKVTHCFVVLEISALGGRSRLPAGTVVTSLIVH